MRARIRDTHLRAAATFPKWFSVAGTVQYRVDRRTGGIETRPQDFPWFIGFLTYGQR